MSEDADCGTSNNNDDVAAVLLSLVLKSPATLPLGEDGAEEFGEAASGDGTSLSPSNNPASFSTPSSWQWTRSPWSSYGEADASVDAAAGDRRYCCFLFVIVFYVVGGVGVDLLRQLELLCQYTF